MKAINPLIRGYELMIIWARPVTRWVVLLVVRIVWGWAFFVAGRGKLGDINKPIQFFTQLKIPFPTVNAWFVSILECFGGLLLLVGLGSRPIALLLAIDMVVAYITADRESISALFTDSDIVKFSSATPFWFMVACMLIFAWGPGLFSLDAVVRGLRRRGDESPLATLPLQQW